MNTCNISVLLIAEVKFNYTPGRHNPIDLQEAEDEINISSVKIGKTEILQELSVNEITTIEEGVL